jgi:hypothetical protein
MDSEAARLLITQKLADGRLPHHSIPRVWRGAGGEICDACEEGITRLEFIMERVSRKDGQHPIRRGIQFHVKCSQLLDQLVATSGGQSFDGQIERMRELAVRSRVNIESSRDIVAASKKLVAEVSDVILSSRHQRCSWREVGDVRQPNPEERKVTRSC